MLLLCNNILKSEESVGKQGHFNSFKRENQERSYVVTGAQTCVFCKNSHLIYNCPEFLNLSVVSRSQEIKKRHLCFNCLRTNHRLKDCHTMTCRKCNKNITPFYISKIQHLSLQIQIKLYNHTQSLKKIVF